MPAASAARGSRSTVTRPAAIAAGQNRLPGPREADAGVGRVHRRVEPAHEQPHAGAHGVGQRARPHDAGVQPLAGVASLQRLARRSRRRRARRAARPRSTPRTSARGSRRRATNRCARRASNDNMRGRVDRQRPVEIGERQRAGRSLPHVEVARARPRGPERAAAERQRLEVGLQRHAPGAASGPGRPSRTPRRARPAARAGAAGTCPARTRGRR